MTDWRLDLWSEMIADSFQEHGVEATVEQVRAVAADAQGMHENWDMVEPTPSGPSPAEIELQETKKTLEKERDKVHCRLCNGSGTERIDGPAHYSLSKCWKCGGQGRHAP